MYSNSAVCVWFEFVGFLFGFLLFDAYLAGLNCTNKVCFFSFFSLEC